MSGAPGWYPDPADPTSGHQRFFNGEAWTSDILVGPVPGGADVTSVPGLNTPELPPPDISGFAPAPAFPEGVPVSYPPVDASQHAETYQRASEAQPESVAGELLDVASDAVFYTDIPAETVGVVGSIFGWVFSLFDST